MMNIGRFARMGYDMQHVTMPSDAPEEDEGYFRLNIWGMSQYREAMFLIGMLDTSPEPDTGWPKDPPGIDWDEFYEDRNSYPEYREALEAFLSAKGSGTGIGAWKFTSNDGWIVTPEECVEALDSYAGAMFPDPFDDDAANEYWHKWIKYLTDAIGRDGFRVW